MRSANNGQQEIYEAQKRMSELDGKIKKLYESALNGLLPERQAQRMIQQYDEEQLVLEKRIEELQGQIKKEKSRKSTPHDLSPLSINTMTARN